MTSIALAHSPDLVALAGAARDAGYSAMLIERPMPDAVSVLGIGRAWDIVASPDGTVLEDAHGTVVDREPGGSPLAAAARLWGRLATRLGGAQVGPAGTGAIAIGGFAFDPSAPPAPPWDGFPALLFRVPELTLTRVRGRSWASGDLDLLELEPGFRGPRARTLTLAESRSKDQFCESVAAAVRRLGAGEAEKVVLARELVASADGVFAAANLVASLRAAHPSCFSYLISGADGTTLIGASPELLVRRSGLLATSQPMAGSAARGPSDEDDEALAQQLLGSPKDASEHALTSDHVLRVLSAAAVSVSASPAEVARFADIQHLATTITAHLREPAASLLELADRLHPTPAVNGFPAAAARRMIDEIEPFERGWYAGAVGWMDARGDGELAVALRCGLLWEDAARLYAGVGVMPNSDPEHELAETELKFRALIGALSGAR
ncbi:MAG: isochorismate synthase [Candidatus Dormibacteraceae bacterium]